MTARALEFCPKCRQKLEFSKREKSELEEAFHESLSRKEYETAAEYCRILADTEYGTFAREYGVMLEKGNMVPRNYDLAMKYFLFAAKRGDAYSAYRYSRLVSRGNDRAGRFWLLYSALLGVPEAYPAAAKLLSKEGDDLSANMFYSLAAKHDDIDSIVELASRYFKGTGLPESPECAKWYMEKLTFPPIHALKLAYKLRSVKSREPAEKLFDKEPLIRLLTAEAGKCGFSEAYFSLNKMLADFGDMKAMTICATLLADGEGCEKNINEAVRMFTEAASGGSAEAYLCLADIFSSEDYSESSPELCARYLEAAGKLGAGEGYMRLGELYETGDFLEKDYKKAEDFYRRAGELGLAEAAERANAIVRERERIYAEARNSVSENPKKAFRGYAIAAAMGHPSAPLKLADAYLGGVGVEPSRQAAYYWYRTAAEAGDTKALYPLGLCYIDGVGINRDYSRGKDMLLKAARLGSEGARRVCAGIMEAKRKKLARSLFSKASRLIYKKKFSAALDLAKLSLELESAKAAYLLGTMYEFGLGTETDRKAAGLYYNEAYRRGYIDHDLKFKKTILKLIR